MAAPELARRRRRRGGRAEQGSATLLACCGLLCAAAVLQGSLRCFAGGAPVRRARGCARQAAGQNRQVSDPERPWKSVVFKMPKMSKPEREIETEDDAFTKDMRARLKGLDLKPDAKPGETRGVNEAKIDDVLGKEVDDAKINGLYTMWYIDKQNDRLKAERDTPDKHVMRKRFQEQKDKLLGVPVVADKTPARREPSGGPGFLQLTNVQDIDRLIEEARTRPPKPLHEASPGEDAERPEQDRDVVDYLTAVQQRSQREDKGSRRVVKSKEQRREDYEETKQQILSTTAALGATGTLGFALASGVDAAFSFGLGSLAALSYLTGLSSYTDNADNPVGAVSGGRRFLAPVLLVLLVEGWDRVEARIEQVAALGLHPQLLPAILGFLMYSVGKVLQGLLPKGPAARAER